MTYFVWNGQLYISHKILGARKVLNTNVIDFILFRSNRLNIFVLVSYPVQITYMFYIDNMLIDWTI